MKKYEEIYPLTTVEIDSKISNSLTDYCKSVGRTKKFVVQKIILNFMDKDKKIKLKELER